MHDKLFEAALGIQSPWSVTSVRFDEEAKVLTVVIDFERGTRFAADGAPGTHPVHDTVTKSYRHLNFFQHECHLQVRTPRVKLPDGSVRLVEPPFAGRLSGFTLLFEALVLMLAQQMPFAAVARIVGESAPRVMAVCERYVEMALAVAGLDGVIAKMTTVRTARAWLYMEQLREMLERKQVNVVRSMLGHWCTCVMRSKVEAMKEVAGLVRRHLEGIVAWAQTRQTNGFLEALNGLFQAAKRRARGFTRMSTIRTVIFLIAGKLDFRVINPHATQPT